MANSRIPSDYKRRPFIAMVGSRLTPKSILFLMQHIAHVATDNGLSISSGDADGADLSSYIGASLSDFFHYNRPRIYLPWGHVRYFDRDRHADGEVFIDASKLPNYERAKEIAADARGSFEGLKHGGIALHTRNAYQILLDDLETPVQRVVYWAEPVGKKGRVKGGTNTAVQIAIKYGIPTVNLATEDGLERAHQYLISKGRPYVIPSL